MSLALFRSGDAALDLVEIWDHIANDSPTAADRLLARLKMAEQQLLLFPQMGQSRPDVRVDVRHWPVGDYLILYRVTAERLEIVRVVHGARDLGGLFDEDT